MVVVICYPIYINCDPLWSFGMHVLLFLKKINKHNYKPSTMKLECLTMVRICLACLLKKLFSIAIKKLYYLLLWLLRFVHVRTSMIGLNDKESKLFLEWHYGEVLWMWTSLYIVLINAVHSDQNFKKYPSFLFAK